MAILTLHQDISWIKSRELNYHILIWYQTAAMSTQHRMPNGYSDMVSRQILNLDSRIQHGKLGIPSIKHDKLTWYQRAMSKLQHLYSEEMQMHN